MTVLASPGATLRPAQRALLVESEPAFGLRLTGDAAVSAEPPRSFVTWLGNKRLLASHVVSTFPALNDGTYYEPFAGSGSVALAYLREGERAVLSDVNADLMAAWKVITGDSSPRFEGLLALMAEHSRRHSKNHYLRQRSLNAAPGFGLTVVEAAARFIYLNKAGYNGLIRYNDAGNITTAWGDKRTVGNQEKRLRGVRQWAQGRTIETRCSDYASVLNQAVSDDVVYLDSPYDCETDAFSFTNYSAGGFGRNEQRRLYRCAVAAVRRGVHVTASNADTDLVRELWSGDGLFGIERLSVPRSVGKRWGAEDTAAEVLMVSR